MRPTSAPLAPLARRAHVALLLLAGAMLCGATWAADPPKLQGLPPADAASFNEKLATNDQVRQLRAGGFTLYLRHGTTDNAKPDRVPTVDLNDCSTQRPLTEAGRQLMAQVGESIRRHRVPFSEFHVSPMCRAKESAAAAFPKQPPVVDNNLMYVANFTDAEKAPIIANTRALLSTPVQGKTNRLVLAHAPNLMDLMGYFPKEGTLVIFKPKGDGFEYVGSIPPTHWASLQP